MADKLGRQQCSGGTYIQRILAIQLTSVWLARACPNTIILENIQNFACRVCLKWWNLSQLSSCAQDSQHASFGCMKTTTKLCTFFSYVNQLYIAPIASITHRVPPFQSRHIHALYFVCPIAQYIYSFSPHTNFFCGTIYLILQCILIPQLRLNTPYNCIIVLILFAISCILVFMLKCYLKKQQHKLAKMHC